jgi:CDP-glucose 4,6-dehydratase
MADWSGKRVLLTGHTGFKGSWLAMWLHALGAEITGFSLPPPTQPSLFDEARVAELVHHVEGDVRDAAALADVMREARPEVVFHLAAQPLVRLSYEQPVETYATNVMGTVHLLEAVRQVGGVRAVICITSDKCYENREWVWPYRECDPMGGHDPYSSSKGAAELVIAAYRHSYFDPARIAEHGVGLASVRAGNVIGGGDWAADRLVPDIIRAFQAGAEPIIRSPGSVRPWQHVLEALGGYILIAERLLAGQARFAEGWNFGPADADARPVSWIANRLAQLSGSGIGWMTSGGPQPHEAITLKLDCSKARSELGWRPAMDLDSTLSWITQWHRDHAAGLDARSISLDQIHRYRRAVERLSKEGTT